jgi:carbon monoxide dehydrogenase subunit G
MEFIAEQDIPAPPEDVFATLTDFEMLAREAEARGAVARRSDDLAEPGAGAAWRIEYTMRGTQRRAIAQVTEWQPPEGYAVSAQTSLIVIDTRFTLAPAGAGATRLRVEIAVSARGLSGRILLQSARLGRGRLEQRLHTALDRLADRVAERLAGR